MLKKNIIFFSLAVICLLIGQAAAVSENLTSIENGYTTSENNICITYENNESIPSGNNYSELFSLAPLNPEFEEYLEKEELSEERVFFTSSEPLFPEIANSGEEAENLVTGLTPAPVDLSHLKTVESPEGLGNYPASYDLRALGLVSPVRDQKDAGSCWTFGAYASLESYILKTEGKNRDFSENNMKNLLSEDYPEGFDRSFDDGGNEFISTAYFARWSGPVSETDDSYDPHSGVSPTDLPSLKRVQKVLFLPARSGPQDNELIKWALMNYGVLDSSVHFSPDAYDSANCSHYYSGSEPTNHMIGIVGWDDSFDRNKFTPAAPGDGAFIVKNSWGTGWGDEGFFYVSYYDIGIGTGNAVHMAEDLGSYSHVYQYDPLGWVESVGYSDSNTAWAANVFTAEEAETLEAVSFYTTASDTGYEIYVYTGTDSGPINPDGAETSVNGTIPFAGYHTVSLDPGVPLEAGQNFSVVVKFTTPDYSYPVAVEFPMKGHSSKARANPGESFFSPDGKNWVDTSLAVENMNVCIKAFTNRSEAAKVAFTADVTSGPAPLTVEFIDASTFSPTAWYWDFGDGSNSTARFPVHTYAKAGKYNVTLRVENGYGNNTAEKTEWIRATNASLFYVDDNGPADFSSIQAAVDAASPGATIFVKNGNYTENVDVDRAVTIISEAGPEYTEVKAANPKDSVFYVTADAVNISGFSISGGSELPFDSSYPTAGIWLYDARDCNISGNALSNNYCGISVIASGNCTLSGNMAESNSIGILMDRSEGNSLRNNRLENNSLNFEVKAASAEQDIDESNTVDGRPIYYLVNETDLLLDSDSNAGTVYCIDCRNVTVRDLNLSGNYYGLYLYNTTDSHVENISSSENNYGFCIVNSRGLNFTNNSASSNGYGLSLEDSEWESFSRNRMEGNAYSFYIKGNCSSQSVPYMDSSNLLDGKPLYILSGVSDYVLGAESGEGPVCLLNCRNVTVRDLAFRDSLFGVYIYGTEEAIIVNNTFYGNQYGGAYLESSWNSTVEGNEFSGNSYGIYLKASSGNTLTNNTLSKNPGWGICLYESCDNIVSSNNASGNKYGIYVSYSDDNCFVENTVSDNALGFLLFGSKYNTLTANTANSNRISGFDLTISRQNILSGNTVLDNSRGITLQGSLTNGVLAADNILCYNTVSNNLETGVWLFGAENNTFYGNAFNNTKNVEDYGQNIWNSTAGNYWSDYSGPDADKNGIGDTPYVVNSLTSNKDYLPLSREPGVPLTFTVGYGDEDFSSIQAAVDAAWEGDTLLVSPGTYMENILVNKSVSIISSSGNPDDTIVLAADPEEHVFNVTADSVTISGFTVSGASEEGASGIYMERVSGCSLSGNVLSGSYFGAWLIESENCSLFGNTVTGGRFGIWMEGSDNNTAVGNSISSVSNCGLWLGDASGNELSGNELQDSGYGVVLDLSNENELRNNTISGNDNYGLWLGDASGNELSGNELRDNGYGVILDLSNGNELYNNTISGSAYYGLYLSGSEANILRNNSMQSSTFNFMGDYLFSGDLLPNDIDTSNLVDGKPIYHLVGESDLVLDSASNAGAVYLIGCENVTVRDLVLEKNGFGVFVSESSNSTLYNLTVSDNEYGILGFFDSYRNCSNSTVVNNMFGIVFVAGNNNKLNNNSISENEYGLMLGSDSGVLRDNLISGNEYNFGVEPIFGVMDYDIDTSNLVDGKPIYYLKGESGRVLDASSNAGTVYLFDCENITVRDQVLEHNMYGISLYNTTNSSLAGNRISSNNEGLVLYDSCNISIYNNFFSNNLNVRLMGDCAGNTWNVSRTEGPNILGDPCIGGNCWANPQGTGFSQTTPDADGDGFCDLPYGIPGSGSQFDSLPLYTPPEVTNNGEDGEEEEEHSVSSGSHAALFSGVSGMPSTHVLTASVSRQQVLAGQQAEFRFSEPGCSVTGISFVSGTSAGTVTGRVETLNGLPDTVPAGPEGAVYQYMNIVVGSRFFGESGTFEGAVIDFKVPRAWVEENNIDKVSIVLNRFHDDAWVPLETEKTGEDAEFFYFRAETPGFSYYSITGQKLSSIELSPAEGQEGDGIEGLTGNEAATESPENKKSESSPGFGFTFAVAGLFSVIYCLKRS